MYDVHESKYNILILVEINKLKQKIRGKYTLIKKTVLNINLKC